MDPNANTWFDMAKVTAMNQNLSLALEQLEKSLIKGFKDLQKIENDPMLVSLRSEAAYKSLLQKYFKKHTSID